MYLHPILNHLPIITPDCFDFPSESDCGMVSNKIGPSLLQKVKPVIDFHLGHLCLGHRHEPNYLEQQTMFLLKLLQVLANGIDTALLHFLYLQSVHMHCDMIVPNHMVERHSHQKSVGQWLAKLSHRIDKHLQAVVVLNLL